MMLLYANGCSFVYGQELQNPEISAWPNILAKKLNIEVLNKAEPGSSNDRIFRTTHEFICDYKNKHDLFVVVGWSLCDRYELFYAQLQLYFQIINYYNNIFLTSQQYIPDYDTKLITEFTKHFKSDLNSNEQITIRYISSIFTLCKYLQIKCLFFNSIASFMLSENIKILRTKIPKLTKVMIPIYKNNSIIQLFQNDKSWIDKTFFDFAMENNYQLGKTGHPLEDAHTAWGDYLYDYIIANDIINKK